MGQRYALSTEHITLVLQVHHIHILYTNQTSVYPIVFFLPHGLTIRYCSARRTDILHQEPSDLKFIVMKILRNNFIMWAFFISLITV